MKDDQIVELERILLELKSVVVAYSGGVDSTFLAAFATACLGSDHVRAVIADSASLPRHELEEALTTADLLGFELTIVKTNEFNDNRYIKNDALRCSYCKSALMDAIGPIAIESGAQVVLGVNLTDQGDYRPGQQAASMAGARFPLLEAKITKEMVRQYAKQMGIPNHDKPASPCLSSRIPYGTSINLSLLGRIERAERFLQGLGFAEVRVRDFDDTARIEVKKEQMLDLVVSANTVHKYLKKLGYTYVTLDLGGLVSGNLNLSLAEAQAPR